jgi:chemotaxis signal transduction protein
MMSMVRFRTDQGVFLAATENVLEVRTTAALKSLPGHKEGVAGLIERNGRALTVLSTFGTQGGHVLLLSAGTNFFGLLATEVSGVVNVSELDIEPAPAGQTRPLISGVVKAKAGLELMVSVDALWRELLRTG